MNHPRTIFTIAAAATRVTSSHRSSVCLAALCRAVIVATLRSFVAYAFFPSLLIADIHLLFFIHLQSPPLSFFHAVSQSYPVSLNLFIYFASRRIWCVDFKVIN